jgi:hypothetical protein
MKNCLVVLFALIAIGTSAFAQEDVILPAQADAIRSLAIEKGFTLQSLNEYLIQEWGVPLETSSRKDASEVFAVSQSATPPSPADLRQPEPQSKTKRRISAPKDLSRDNT